MAGTGVNKKQAREWLKLHPSCVACGAIEDLSVDHIIPQSAGGPDEFSNYQTLCMTCNRVKGAKSNEEFFKFWAPTPNRPKSVFEALMRARSA